MSSLATRSCVCRMSNIAINPFAHHRKGVRITSDYAGDLRCNAVHEPSQSSLSTDAPLDNKGRGEKFSPTDLIAAGLCCCIETIIGIKLKDMNVPGSVRIAATKEMSTDTPRRIARIPLTAWINVPLSEEQKGSLILSARGCPVKKSLNKEISIPAVFIWADGATTKIQLQENHTETE